MHATEPRLTSDSTTQHNLLFCHALSIALSSELWALGLQLYKMWWTKAQLDIWVHFSLYYASTVHCSIVCTGWIAMCCYTVHQNAEKWIHCVQCNIHSAIYWVNCKALQGASELRFTELGQLYAADFTFSARADFTGDSSLQEQTLLEAIICSRL